LDDYLPHYVLSSFGGIKSHGNPVHEERDSKKYGFMHEWQYFGFGEQKVDWKSKKMRTGSHRLAHKQSSVEKS